MNRRDICAYVAFSLLLTGPTEKLGAQSFSPGSGPAINTLDRQLTSLDSRLILMEDGLGALIRGCETLQRGNVQNHRLAQDVMNKITETMSQDGELSADQMTQLETQLEDLAALGRKLQGSDRDVAELKRKQEEMQKELDQLKADIAKLKQEFAQAQSRAGGKDVEKGPTEGQRRASAALPLPPDSPAAKPLLGQIKLVNSFQWPVTVIVDGRFYNLATNDALSLDRQPGTFTYKVVGIQGNTSRSLAAGELLTIRIVPR